MKKILKFLSQTAPASVRAHGILKVLLLSLSFFTAVTAHALTPDEVRESYRNCMAFLEMSPERQAEVASRTQYSLAQFRWACSLQKQKGLEELLRDEREYQRCLNGACSSPNRPHERRCVSSMQCRGSGENCMNGKCQLVNSSNHCGQSGLRCANGESCVNGHCRN